MLVTLEQIKKHLNIDNSYTDEDEYLTMLEETAEQLIEKAIDKSFDDIIADSSVVPSPLLSAILLEIANLYANRESVAYTTVSEVPKSLDYILSLYRDYTDCNI